MKTTLFGFFTWFHNRYRKGFDAWSVKNGFIRPGDVCIIATDKDWLEIGVYIGYTGKTHCFWFLNSEGRSYTRNKSYVFNGVAALKNLTGIDNEDLPKVHAFVMAHIDQP